MGAILSLVVFAMTSVFLYSKVMVLYKKTDITIMMNQLEGALTFEDKFGPDDGFFVAAALTEYNSETEVLEERTDILVAAAEQVDAWIATQFAAIPEEQRVIVSAHDAFQYFGQRYGITFEPLLGLSTASETKLARVNELVQLVEERQISAVFSETSVESAGITALREGAASKGIELRSLPPLFSDALGQEGEPGGSYFSMLLENTINMVDAMTGERPEPTPELLAFLSTHNLFHSEETQ